MAAVPLTMKPVKPGVLTLFFTGFALSLFFTGSEGRLFFLSQILLWLFVAGQLLRASGRIVLPSSWAGLILLFFLVLSCCSQLWSPVPGYTQTQVWLHTSVFLVFFGLVQLTGDTWKKYRLLITCVALITASCAVVQYLLGQQPQATYLNKNSLAGFLLPLIFWALINTRNPWQNRFDLALLFTTSLVLGLIASRGAFLALTVGVVCVIVLARTSGVSLGTMRGRAYSFFVGLFTSVLLTGLNLGGGLGRLATLQDPWNAGSSRFLIWQSSWEMFRDAPWYGIGAGIYGLLYKQYRLPDDRSAGHLAHNDLLQIGIELGWPGLILALLICFFLARMVVRALHHLGLADDRKAEIIVLAAGLLAVLFHSLFTFHLYVYSTLLVIGVVFARLHVLFPEGVSKLHSVNLARYGPLFGITPVLVCLVPLTLLSFGLISQQATEKALSAQDSGDTENAVRHLRTAKRFWPANDFNWYMEGEVIRLGIQHNSQMDDERRTVLFSLAQDAYEKAIQLNPLRAAAPHKLGLLIEQNPYQAESLQPGRVVALYQQSLAIEPRYFAARIDLARRYATNGLEEKVLPLLEEGLRYHYYDSAGLVSYLAVARHYREVDGDLEGAQELRDRIDRIRLDLQEKEG